MDMQDLACTFPDWFIDRIGEGFLFLDAEFRVQRYSIKGLRVDALLHDQIAGRHLLDVWPAAESLPVWPALQRAMTEETPVQLRYHDLSGARDAWIEVCAYPSADGVSAFFRDVTAQQQKTVQLVDSQEFLRSMLDACKDCVKVVALDMRLEFMNACGQRLMEIDNLDAIRGRNWTLLWPPELGPRVEAALDAARRGHADRFEAFCPTAKGTPKWWDVVISPIRDRTGQVAHLLFVSRDITARKQAEAALHESEARLRSILETLPDAVVVIDEQDRIESFSRASERMFGYVTEDVIGREIGMLLPGWAHDGRPASGQRMPGGGSAVWMACRKDRSCFPVELATGEIAAAGGRRLFTCFMRDVSERLAAETRLHELQGKLFHVSRVSAAGEIASALAHELNQPLAAITSATRAAQRMITSLPDADPAAGTELNEAVELAAGQALRAGQIVRKLRDFVSPGETERRLEDLRRVIEEAADLSLVDARERGIEVSCRFDAGLPPVVVDRIQVQQVLLNLIRNAVEAMSVDEPGRDARRELRIAAAPADDNMAVVEVADTGPGLAADIAGRLFDSFASTKPGGMGMGLSISRSIIEAHGGRLWAEANPGGGTVFRFTLPVAVGVGGLAA